MFDVKMETEVEKELAEYVVQRYMKEIREGANVAELLSNPGLTSKDYAAIALAGYRVREEKEKENV